jgi:hypothetical protein
MPTASLRACAARGVLFGLCFLLVPVSEARGQGAELVAGFANGTAVSAAADALGREARSVVETLRSAYDTEAFNTRSHLLTIIGTLEVVAGRLLDKTMGELTEQQRLVFTNVRQAIDQAESTGVVLGTQATAVADAAGDAFSRVPLADRDPIVRQILPRAVLAGQSVTIVASGTMLRRKEPTFTVGSTTCTRVAKTDRDIRFECPGSLFPPRADRRAIRGVLRVYTERSMGQAITDFFSSNDRRSDERVYEAAITVIAPELGTALVQAIMPNDTVEVRARERRFEWRNNQCQDPRDVSETVSPDSGWTMDTDGVEVSRGPVSSRSTPATISGVTHSGFQIRARLQNSGQCIRNPIGSGYLARDASSVVIATATWTERRTVLRNGTRDVRRAPLKWGQDYTIPLPPGNRGFIVTLDRVDGQRTVHVTAGDYPWMRVESAPLNAAVVLKPFAIAKVFGQ